MSWKSCLFFVSCLALATWFATCSRADDAAISGPQWKPIGNRKAKVVLWGIVHNHARGKFNALLKLTDDFDVVGWVDDTASTAMRMKNPDPKNYEKFPKLTPDQVLNEVKPDLIVVEVSNSELVEGLDQDRRGGISDAHG